MSDGTALMLVLGVLYLIDCFIWVDRGDVLFVARLCSRWRAAFSSRFISNGDGGFNLLNPFPPFGKVFLGHFFSCSFSPEAVCAQRRLTPDSATRPVLSSRVWRYDDIERVEVDGKRVFVDGELLARCGSSARARWLRDRLDALCGMASQKREAYLKEVMTSMFDVGAIRKRSDEVLQESDALQTLVLMFFLTVFVGFPLIGTTVGSSFVLIPGAVLLVLGGITIGWKTFSIHRRLYPERLGARIGILVKCVLCPPSAMRARDFLTRFALHGYHPVAVLSVFGDAEREGLASRLIRDGAHPLPYEEGLPEVDRIVSWWWALEQAAIQNVVESWDPPLQTDAVLLAPDWDGESSHYCPRCQCQLSPIAKTCPDCSGVTVLPHPGCVAGS